MFLRAIIFFLLSVVYLYVLCLLCFAALPLVYLLSSYCIFMRVELKSSTLREEHKLRVCENRVLRGIFGPNRDEVT
jgi:hypothetical protein